MFWGFTIKILQVQFLDTERELAITIFWASHNQAVRKIIDAKTWYISSEIYFCSSDISRDIFPFPYQNKQGFVIWLLYPILARTKMADRSRKFERHWWTFERQTFVGQPRFRPYKGWQGAELFDLRQLEYPGNYYLQTDTKKTPRQDKEIEVYKFREFNTLKGISKKLEVFLDLYLNVHRRQTHLKVML